jgi:hypothetical protein
LVAWEEDVQGLLVAKQSESLGPSTLTNDR